MRLPMRQIKAYLLRLNGVTIRMGEIFELLHRMKAQMHPQLDALKREIRGSPAVQADETGWREDGSNGYIWSVSPPSVRYYEYHHSRAGEVVKQLIGSEFEGVLGSDFYAGYNIHQGLHQRMPGSIFYAISMTSKRSFRRMRRCSVGPKPRSAIYEQAIAFVQSGPDLNLPPRHQQQVREAQQHA